MGKNQLVREELLQLIEDRWRFRIKNVSGHRYITRRKKQKEKSLGPFNEDLWNLILQVEYEHALIEGEGSRSVVRRVSPRFADEESELEWRRSIRESQDRFLRMLAYERSRRMSCDCDHIVNGLCEYWVWDQEPLFYGHMVKVYRPEAILTRVDMRDGSKKWVFRADSLYCGGCTAYRRVADISDIP
jgi:hypothetical protein